MESTQIEELIKEMQKVKTDYPILEFQDILRMFAIITNRDLVNQMRRMANN